MTMGGPAAYHNSQFRSQIMIHFHRRGFSTYY